MFPGGFRTKLNSRSHRRASVFATTVVALHPSFLSLYPLLTYAYFSYSVEQLKSGKWDLSCLCVVRRRPYSQLSCNSMGHCAFRTNRSVGSIHGGKGEIVWLHRERCRWRASFLLTNWLTVFQSFNPFTFAFTYQQDTYVLLSDRLVTFAPLPYPSSKKPPLLHYQLEGSTTRRSEERDERTFFA